MIIPNFRGKHNNVKAQCWLFLCKERAAGRWLTSLEIHRATGLNLHTLQNALIKWHAWRYIARRERKDSDDLCFYEYQLTVKGVRWVGKWKWLMPIHRYKISH